ACRATRADRSSMWRAVASSPSSRAGAPRPTRRRRIRAARSSRVRASSRARRRSKRRSRADLAMTRRMRTACVTSLMLLALGCGVPQTQYDAAVDDAKKARAECDAKLAEHDKANQQAIDDLKQKLSDAEARAGNADEQTKAELEELRKAKAAAEARAKLFD